MISKVTNGINNWKKIFISDNKKYIGELSDKEPDGIGILFKVEQGIFGGENIEYIGYFKKGKFEGYGRKYGIFKDLKYLGFFRNDIYEGFWLSAYGQTIYYEGYFIEGKYNNYGKQFQRNKLYYQGYFIRDKHHGKWIIYYQIEKIYISGIFNDNLIDGISYDPNGNKIYEGIFINENPKEGKNLRIYEYNGEIKYEGDFLEGNYNGYGILYGKGSITEYNLKLYEGEFKEGKYYGLGKKYQDNYLGNYLYYEGNFNNNIFDGKGILFYQNGQKFYEGNFQENKIEGEGIKYYQNGSKKIEGIFDTFKKCEGKYYDPENKEMYRGKIINEIPIDSKKIILYNDNTFKIYEGEMNKGYYNGYGIEYCPQVKDLILFEGYFLNNYYISPNTKVPNNICQI